jgi:hypothetical protein
MTQSSGQFAALPEPSRGSAYAELLAAHRAGEDALQRDEPHYADGIAWLSAHLSALELTVYPVARGALAREQVVEQASRTRRLIMQLRLLHARVSGASQWINADLDAVRADLATILAEHRHGEEQLLQSLAIATTDRSWTRVVDGYRRSLAHAPTRPHPYTLHHGPGAQLAQRLLALVDRALDVMDSRPVHPLPSPLLAA